MPGILLNRLSRPKEGQTPEQVLENGKNVLLGEMLPVLAPDACEGIDYLYVADIISRLDTNKEGKILDTVLQAIRKQQCSWVAVTEIARISGDGQSMFAFADACREHRVPIYTRDRLYHPFQPWRAESYRDLATQFFMSLFEVSTYQVRYERFRENALPINVETGESRNRLRRGLGRHINGRVPLGYVWDKRDKKVLPDNSIPFPTYIAPGQDTPAALTWWEIVSYARRLGLTQGVNEAAMLLALETGAHFHVSCLVRLWHNPFYAGRPTSTLERIGGRLQKRLQPVYTEGDYEAMETWEQHSLLQEAIAGRHNQGAKGNRKGNWASGLVKCACGQPFLSNGGYYICRGAKRDTDVRCESKRRETVGEGFTLDRHKLPEGWQRSKTCGILDKAKVHAHVENILRELFARPEFALRLAAHHEARQGNVPNKASLLKQQQDMQGDLKRFEEQRQRAIDLAIEGAISRSDLAARQSKLEVDIAALTLRLDSLNATLSAPDVAPASLEALRAVLEQEFDALWQTEGILSDHQRGSIARGLLNHVPVSGIKHHRVFGAPVFPAWL